jgi:hypothetical protein
MAFVLWAAPAVELNLVWTFYRSLLHIIFIFGHENIQSDAATHRRITL